MLFDDDLGDGAITDTGLFKELVTCNASLRAERKYQDPFSFKPYAKLIACSNHMLESRGDDGDGFYRRLHPIYVKEKHPDRINITNFDALVVSENEQILR